MGSAPECYLWVGVCLGDYIWSTEDPHPCLTTALWSYSYKHLQLLITGVCLAQARQAKCWGANAYGSILKTMSAGRWWRNASLRYHITEVCGTLLDWPHIPQKSPVTPLCWLLPSSPLFHIPTTSPMVYEITSQTNNMYWNSCSQAPLLTTNKQTWIWRQEIPKEVDKSVFVIL